VSCAANGTIAAFAVREPADRIALLYCRPAHQHQGHAGRLLLALEQGARQEGIARLRTEASFLSRALFRRQGWQPSWQEELLINGIHFRRFRLHKPLQPILS
jgi:GNAT superfamily N-acetyltransferase